MSLGIYRRSSTILLSCPLLTHIEVHGGLCSLLFLFDILVGHP